MNEKRFIELLTQKKSGRLTLPEQRELSELDNKDSFYSLMESFVDEVFKTPLNFEPSLCSQAQQSSFEIIKEKINKPETVFKNKKIKVFRILQAAASIILIVALSVIGYLSSGKLVSSESPNIISTKKGSKTNIVLPDGTQVWLNADSKITYEKSFGTSAREVFLTGEAFFDVTHNALKPFIVHTGKADIKVLGTTFNVRNYNDDNYVEAALVKGKIEVLLKDHPANKIVLSPSEKITIKKEDVEKNTDNPETLKNAASDIFTLAKITQKDSVIAETSWVQNRQVFINKSLGEIVADLKRQFNVTVVFKTKAVKNYRYTIYTDNLTLDEILQMLKNSKEFNYLLKGNELIVE